jgi:hypothetical protein
MWRMIAFAPVLAFLPVLLVVGIIFLVVPGGFILVLGAVFYASLALFGAVGAAAKTRWDTRSAHGYPTSQPGYRPAGLGTPALQPSLRCPVTGGPAGRVAAAAPPPPPA